MNMWKRLSELDPPHLPAHAAVKQMSSKGRVAIRQGDIDRVTLVQHLKPSAFMIPEEYKNTTITDTYLYIYCRCHRSNKMEHAQAKAVSVNLVTYPWPSDSKLSISTQEAVMRSAEHHQPQQSGWNRILIAVRLDTNVLLATISTTNLPDGRVSSSLKWNQWFRVISRTTPKGSINILCEQY